MTNTDKPAALPGADMTSPVDLPPIEGGEAHPLLWASTAIAVASAFLLLFNASALRSWAYEREPGPVNERVVGYAEGWFAVTERFYLDRPVAAMSGWWDAMKAIGFRGSDAEAAPEPAEPEPVAAEEPRPGFTVQ
ncbi:hypothetical protein [Parasphingopyxis marina]|uniref:Uncharacterized protein n=1 Tax=Parasphingopyxis marina TaxID=2761622 RepID=A0A842HWJ5_9SPHN|nr:hypothetical protein [Parasphingopyxis marina]MBC2776833.1 hypothetical protein [Parasphingopyxis marina]